MNAVDDLLHVLHLEKLEINLFRGISRDIGLPQVFGGQVLGQALAAATATIGEDRAVHSLHAYFLLAGDAAAPIIYEVDRSRDGGSFSSRRVVAIQHGQPIFHMSASFQVEQPGIDHHLAMPDAPSPESLLDIREVVAQSPSLPEELSRWYGASLPIEFRPVDPDKFISSKRSEPITRFWFRAVAPLPEDGMLQRCVLAYASDFYPLLASLHPHGLTLFSPRLRFATIDHAMWFHRPACANEWLLYSIDSPSASGSRGLSRGSIFNRRGELIASVAQEGLLRVKEPQP